MDKEKFRADEDRLMTTVMAETVSANLSGALVPVQAAADAIGINERQVTDNAVNVPSQSQVSTVVTTNIAVFNVAPVNPNEPADSLTDQAAALLAAGNARSAPQRSRPLRMITKPSGETMFNSSEGRSKRPMTELDKPASAKRSRVDNPAMRKADSDSVLRNAFNSAGGSNPQRLAENPPDVETSLVAQPWVQARGRAYQKALLKSFTAHEGSDKISSIQQQTKFLLSQVPPQLRGEPYNITTYFDAKQRIHAIARNEEDYDAATNGGFRFWKEICETAVRRRNEIVSAAGIENKDEEHRIEFVKRPDWAAPMSAAGKKSLSAQVDKELALIEKKLKAEVTGTPIPKRRKGTGVSFRDFPDPDMRARSPSAPPDRGGFGPLEAKRGPLSPTPEAMAQGGY